MNEIRKRILEKIRNSLNETIRLRQEDSETHIGLPYPYFVPCVRSHFQELYYWDSYFASLGFLKLGNLELVKGVVNNFLHLVNRFGFVPNATRFDMLNRSQPPFLAMLVDAVYTADKDNDWLEKACGVLKKEYQFWMSRRVTSIGLNRYGHHADSEELLAFHRAVEARLAVGGQSSPDTLTAASHALAEAESGWDFTSRFSGRCEDFLPVDLNSILYRFESLMEKFSTALENGERDTWEERKLRRKALICEYLWDENSGAFVDYDVKNECTSRRLTAASLFPFWAQVASGRQAETLPEVLARLEFSFGVVSCEPDDAAAAFQWDYPNCWPPLQFITYKGLQNYGYFEDTHRIAEKFHRLVTGNFELTGELWEKYNAVDGSITACNEYEMPPMIGWSAGIYICVDTLLRSNELK